MRMARSAVRQIIRDDVVSLLTTKGRMPLPVPQLMDVQGGQGKARMAVCATWTAGRLYSSASSRLAGVKVGCPPKHGTATGSYCGPSLFQKGTPF